MNQLICILKASCGNAMPGTIGVLPGDCTCHSCRGSQLRSRNATITTDIFTTITTSRSMTMNRTCPKSHQNAPRTRRTTIAATSYHTDTEAPLVGQATAFSMCRMIA